MAADRHIPVGEYRIDSNRALQLQRISLYKRGCYIRYRVIFFIERVLEGGKPGIAGVYSRLPSVFQFYEGSTRSLYKPANFPISTISFTVQLYS
jgi:hypothetical protein